jgi:membrane protein implicated in regulation of membrane protease activity
LVRSIDRSGGRSGNLTRKSRSWRTASRYALFQVPSILLLSASLFLLHRWVGLSRSIGWTILGLWIAKDIALFPFLRRSFDTDRAGEMNSMVGEEGTVTDRLAFSGRILVRGELWQAELLDHTLSAEPGQRVSVLDVRGLTLIVECSRRAED